MENTVAPLVSTSTLFPEYGKTQVSKVSISELEHCLTYYPSLHNPSKKKVIITW